MYHTFHISHTQNYTYSLTLLSVDLAKPVVAHLVHEAVKKNRRSLAINSELSLWGEIVRLYDVLTLLSAATDTNHPQELVDIYNIHNM